MKNLVGILTGVGAVNWLLVGLFNFNLVSFIFRVEWLITFVYVLVGLSGVIFLVKMCGCKSCCNSCKTCDVSKKEETPKATEENTPENVEVGGHKM